MSLPPVEIPLGAMRFNSDSQKLEYFNGEIWMQVHTFSPDLDGGARGLYFNGSVPGTNEINTIEYVTLSTQGNATNFGDSTIRSRQGTAWSSNTRAIRAGGVDDGGSHRDVMDYVTIASTGNATDFGDLTQPKIGNAPGFANQTRGFCGGGEKGSPAVNVNIIEYVTIAQTGNAKDFGDLTYTAQGESGGGSPTRAIVAGGFTPSIISTINYFTMATTGNAQVFGELSVGRRSASKGQSSNSTRWMMIGGQDPSYTSRIDYITISTLGDATDFGDCPTGTATSAAMSTPIRCVFAGGGDGSNKLNTISYFTFATTGDAVDFGDTSTATDGASGCSNAHGGLG